MSLQRGLDHAALVGRMLINARHLARKAGKPPPRRTRMDLIDCFEYQVAFERANRGIAHDPVEWRASLGAWAAKDDQEVT